MRSPPRRKHDRQVFSGPATNKTKSSNCSSIHCYAHCLHLSVVNQLPFIRNIMYTMKEISYVFSYSVKRTCRCQIFLEGVDDEKRLVWNILHTFKGAYQRVIDTCEIWWQIMYIKWKECYQFVMYNCWQMFINLSENFQNYCNLCHIHISLMMVACYLVLVRIFISHILFRGVW